RNLLRLTSLFTAWLAFWCLYVFIPNTRVKFMPAFISSLLAAIIFLSWQKAYISLQVGVARYNAIYGTFASIPIFLAWLYISWVIVLLGAELAFALQNSVTYQMEGAAEDASAQSKLILALSVLLWAAEALTAGKPRFETGSFAREHKVPIRLLNELVRMLVKVGLLAETADKEGSYVLLKAPDKVRVHDLVDLVIQDGARPDVLGLGKVDPLIESVITSVSRGMTTTLQDLTIGDLLAKRAVDQPA
ncbi:MAG: YhjD/YihY/BrkB family envelope integrity protein, partial [Lentisphaerota bacterium]